MTEAPFLLFRQRNFIKKHKFQFPESNKDFIECETEAEESYQEKINEAEELMQRAIDLAKEAEKEYNDSLYNCPCQETVFYMCFGTNNEKEENL